MKKLLTFLMLLSLCLVADVKLPQMFTDHAVLARSEKTPVFGKADPGEEVTVAVAGLARTAKADAKGYWRVNFDLSAVGEGPYEISVKGKNELTVKDVLVGEVWLCSGQSNMGFQVNREERAQEIIAQSANPKLRLFKMGLYASLNKESRVNARWEVVSPQNVGRFTAVGYLFGKKVQQELQCPVGLIDNAWGGSGIEAWVTKDFLQEDKALAEWSEKSWNTYANYGKNCDEYLAAYGEWLKACGLGEPTETVPPTDAAWKENQGLGGWNRLGPGVIWFRKKINIPQSFADKGGTLNFQQHGARLNVYIDGKEVARNTERQAVYGNGIHKQFKAGELAAGEHELVFRYWTTANGFATARVYYELPGGNPLTRGWQVAVVPQKELTAEQKAAMPKRPSFIADNNKVPELLYNALIYPLLPFRISGTVWYQGCTNAGRPWQYPAAVQGLIKEWRRDFECEFPFYYCQLANYLAKDKDPNRQGWGDIRIGQEGALAMPKTGQAILIDCGEANDIHPLDKLTVGNRLAAIALNRTYGKNVPYSGPVCKGKEIKGNQVILSFDFVEGGLVAKPLPATYFLAKTGNKTAPLVRNSPDSELEGFALCGADNKWYWADARIDGDKVVVWSKDVPAPVKVRYAYQSNPTCNLYNKADFPAGPFEK